MGVHDSQPGGRDVPAPLFCHETASGSPGAAHVFAALRKEIG